jgi:hypothetical protein
LAGLIFGRPEVIEVFDQRDAPSDETADAAVDEEEAGEAEAADLQRAEAAHRPKPPKALEPQRPKQPFLIFVTEIRSDIRASLAAAPPASNRGKGATGRPRKK